jgi:hypothetical protein
MFLYRGTHYRFRFKVEEALLGMSSSELEDNLSCENDDIDIDEEYELELAAIAKRRALRGEDTGTSNGTFRMTRANSRRGSARGVISRQMRNMSCYALSNGNIALYKETLRKCKTSHRESLLNADANTTLSEELRKQHRESKRRIELAEATQVLLFRAEEIEHIVVELPIWIHSKIIPHRWRIQIIQHIEPIHAQMKCFQDETIKKWSLLYPPFLRQNLLEYEKTLDTFEQSMDLLENAIEEVKEIASQGERESACYTIQKWYREYLHKVSS